MDLKIFNKNFKPITFEEVNIGEFFTTINSTLDNLDVCLKISNNSFFDYSDYTIYDASIHLIGKRVYKYTAELHLTLKGIPCVTEKLI